MQEYRTAGIVAQHLRESGYEVTEGIGETGIVGLLRNGIGPVVMLRGDMDALPIKEQSGVDYARLLKLQQMGLKYQSCMHVDMIYM